MNPTPAKTRMAKNTNKTLARTVRESANQISVAERADLYRTALEIIGPVPPKSRMAKTRAKRAEQGRCTRCGRPACVRVIEDAEGRETERERMSKCLACR